MTSVARRLRLRLPGALPEGENALTNPNRGGGSKAPAVDSDPGRPRISIVGAGLAGVEAALQAAAAGVAVDLWEMRPVRQTPAHQTDRLAELVCSNSFGARQVDRAGGLLKEEMRLLGSQVLAAAEANALPAGGALAVDREAFAAQLTDQVAAHPLIHLRREEARALPEGPAIIASGVAPLVTRLSSSAEPVSIP